MRVLVKMVRPYLFTSEDARGNGGLDIYKSTKESNGDWGVPENLGKYY
jgi:hypothetical protein